MIDCVQHLDPRNPTLFRLGESSSAARSLGRLLRSFRGVRFLKRVYKIDLLVR
jgi:hypothetical protein